MNNNDRNIICDWVYDDSFVALFKDMANTAEEFGLKTINGVVFLKGLLNENRSMLYNFFEEYAQKSVPFKEINQDIDEYLKNCRDSEHDSVSAIQLTDEKEETKIFYFDAEVRDIFNYCFQYVINENDEFVSDEIEEEKTICVLSEDLFVAFMYMLPKEAEKILKNHGMPISQDHIDEFMLLAPEKLLNMMNFGQEISKPKDTKITDYLTNMSEKYKSQDCEFLGREEEVKKVFRILQKRSRKNAILVGKAGVGKTAIAEMVAYKIAKGKCPKSLKGKRVFLLDINSIVAGTMWRGMTEERFKIILDFLSENKDVILFIDEIHMMIGAGGTGLDEQNDMSNTFKPYLSSSDSMVIGATTEEEYETYFAKKSALSRRFEKVVVKEPKSSEVYPMLKASIKKHTKHHGVKISKQMVEYAVLIASCFRKTTNNPDRTNNVIDEAMVIAAENGHTSVTKEDILEVFDIGFKKFEKMDVEQKKLTAYHEAGHFIAWYKSNKLKDQKVTAISIMPAEDYLGITVFEDISDEVTIYPDKEYYMELLIVDLAGRVAEKMYTNSLSSGASADLEHANKTAYNMITKTGMIFDSNKTYDSSKLSEKMLNDIDDVCKKLLDEATRKAEILMKDNEKLIKKLVKALLKKGILDENDLEKILNDK